MNTDIVLESQLHTLSSATRNRLRLAYFGVGAPFGRSEMGLALWVIFHQQTTTN